MFNFNVKQFLCLFLYITQVCCIGENCEVSHIALSKNEEAILHIHFPKVVTTQDDQYLCTAFRVPFNGEDSFITQFVPHASMNASHHMLVYGCETPAVQSTSYWSCQDMSAVCSRQTSSILYAWAKNAPPVVLPPHVGFRIGESSKINYLVVQMHYSHAMNENQFDCSGVSAVVTTKPQTFSAGIYLLGAAQINIPPNSNYSKADISCGAPFLSPVYVFAFRTHAHSLSKVITGYRVRNGSVKMIGKGNPQWPHAFYTRIGGNIKILRDDILLARCTYQNNRNSYIHAGLGGNDEMCNFYMMYYSKGSIMNNPTACFGNHVIDAESLFPSTADDLAPYPGFAGKDSISAISRGKAIAPSVPQEHHHHHLTSDMENVTTHHTKDDFVQQGNSNLNDSLHRDHLEMDSSWSLPIEIGQVGGVAVDNYGNLIIFHRANRKWDGNSFNSLSNVYTGSDQPIMENTVVVFNPSNHSIVKQCGKERFYLPHGISVDHEGYVWITDVAMHQVMKFPHSGAFEPLLTLGVLKKPGNDNKHFCKPADVIVDSDGFIYVADGYCNSRIVKFDSSGKFIKSWGQFGARTDRAIPLPSYFNIPHSITLALQHLCVADRENGRIQCFTKEGEFVKIIENINVMGPEVFAITFTKHNGGMLFAVNGIPFQGGKTCGYTIDYSSGKIVDEWCPISQELTRPHDVETFGNEVYIGQLDGNKVLKFKFQKNVAETTVATEVKKNENFFTNIMSSTASIKSIESLSNDNISSTELNIVASTEFLTTDILNSEKKNINAPRFSSKKKVEKKEWNIFLIIILVALPLIASVIACLVIRRRKKNFVKYKEMIQDDNFMYPALDTSKPRRPFIGMFSSENKGFIRLASDDEDTAASDDENDL